MSGGLVPSRGRDFDVRTYLLPAHSPEGGYVFGIVAGLLSGGLVPSHGRDFDVWLFVEGEWYCDLGVFVVSTCKGPLAHVFCNSGIKFLIPGG